MQDAALGVLLIVLGVVSAFIFPDCREMDMSGSIFVILFGIWRVFDVIISNLKTQKNLKFPLDNRH